MPARPLPYPWRWEPAGTGTARLTVQLVLAAVRRRRSLLHRHDSRPPRSSDERPSVFLDSAPRPAPPMSASPRTRRESVRPTSNATDLTDFTFDPDVRATPTATLLSSYPHPPAHS